MASGKFILHVTREIAHDPAPYAWYCKKRYEGVSLIAERYRHDSYSLRLIKCDYNDRALTRATNTPIKNLRNRIYIFDNLPIRIEDAIPMNDPRLNNKMMDSSLLPYEEADFFRQLEKDTELPF